MLRDITLGQYYRADSIIHKLDARLKLIATFIYMISLFCFQGLIGYAIAALFLFSVIKMSKIPLGHMVKGLKAIAMLILMTVVFQLFFTSGTVLCKIGILKLTKEGIEIAVFTILRLTFLILGSSIMTYTTTPNQLTDAIEAVLKPLKYIKVPVHDIAMMMSIALRFIPILIEETDKIMKAQLARGADFENGTIIKRAKSMLPIFVPLFISSFKRADDLAIAMEARCYRGSEGRTKMYPLTYQKRDIVAYAVVAVYFISIIVIPRIIHF